MMTVRCYLAPSKIEGLGVFCRDPIAKGDAIWVLDPRFDRLIPVADADAAEPHVREFIDRYTYPHEDHPGFLVLDADEGRFMNHADKPNTDFTHADRGVALVDIPAGTELTCDYRCFTVGELEFQPPRHNVVSLTRRRRKAADSDSPAAPRKTAGDKAKIRARRARKREGRDAASA